jgi:hypothetical protein
VKADQFRFHTVEPLFSPSDQLPQKSDHWKELTPPVDPLRQTRYSFSVLGMPIIDQM